MKKYVTPEMEKIRLSVSYDVLSVSTSSKTGENDVPDVPIDIGDDL